MLVLGTTASGQRRNMRKNGAVVKCVYLPDTGSMVENLDLGHEAGEEVARVVAVPREHQDLGSLFLLGALRGKTRAVRPWTRRIKCRNPPFTQTSWRSAKAGREPPISLVVSVSSGFVRCTSSRMHRCMQHQIEPSMEQISSAGRQDSNAQFR